MNAGSSTISLSLFMLSLPLLCLLFLSLPENSNIALLFFSSCDSVLPPCGRASSLGSTSTRCCSFRRSLGREEMNSCGYQQKNAMAGGCEERKVMRMVDYSVVCPKPRRLSNLNPSLVEPVRPLRLPVNHQIETGDARAGTELLDIILTKGGHGGEKPGYQVASSPPFYCGSPPSRASNPVVQDAEFGNGNALAFSPASLESPTSSSSSARKGGGCVRMKFGHKPAAVRIEGFDCLSRDQRNHSISAVA